MIVWLNGAYVAAGPLISVADRGFLLGDGAFETIFIDAGRCAFLGAHINRLERSLEAIGIRAAVGPVVWREIAARLARDNDIEGRAAYRITVTRGSGSGAKERGLVADEASAPTLLAALSPLGPPGSSGPASLHLSIARQRRYSLSLGARHKLIGGYTDNMAALAQARAAGADDAVVLNETGTVACASAGNLFAIASDGAVATPRLDDGALPGIVRGLLQAGDHGVVMEERAIDPRELACGGFLTNSLKGIVPVRGKPMGPPAQRAFETLKTWYADTLARELADGNS